MLCLEHTELLPKGKDLEAQVVAGAKEDAEAADHADEEGDHGTKYIPWGDPGVGVNYLIVLRYGVLATHTRRSAAFPDSLDTAPGQSYDSNIHLNQTTD